MTSTMTDPAIAWAEEDLGVLMLTRKHESRLDAFGIKTLGQLSEALGNGQTFRLEPHEITTIKTAFENHMSDIRSQHSTEPAAPGTVAPAEGEEGDEEEFEGKDEPGEPVGQVDGLAERTPAEEEFDNTKVDPFWLPPHVAKILKSFFIETAGELEDRICIGNGWRDGLLSIDPNDGLLSSEELDGLPIAVDMLRATIEKKHAPADGDPLEVKSFVPPQIEAAAGSNGTAPVGDIPDPQLERAKQLIRTRVDREMALDQYDIETTRLVTIAEQEASELWEEYEGLHGRASLKKKEAEAADEELKSLIRQRAKERVGEGEPNLFSGPVRSY